MVEAEQQTLGEGDARRTPQRLARGRPLHQDLARARAALADHDVARGADREIRARASDQAHVREHREHPVGVDLELILVVVPQVHAPLGVDVHPLGRDDRVDVEHLIEHQLARRRGLLGLALRVRLA